MLYEERPLRPVSLRNPPLQLERANAAEGRTAITGSFFTTRCGVVLADASLTPLYLNSEAMRILEVSTRSIPESLHRRLIEVCRGHDILYPFVAQVQSRRRRYLCRAFPLDSSVMCGGCQAPALVLFFERSNITSADLDFVSGTFRLSAREQVALSFLTTGLTNKDIASRMGVSPNTVKAFLRAVMSKMGVATRTELMKIFLDHAYIAHRSGPSASDQDFWKELGIAAPALAQAAGI
jgi:DNA-binding CsgD family transcriptional regulator